MNASKFTVSILSVSKAGNTASSEKYLIRCFDKKDNSSSKISCKLDRTGTLVINGSEAVVSYNRSINNIRNSVKKIIFEKGIIGIGPEAFRDFNNLNEIIISSSVDYIDRGAFMNCDKLSKVFISHGIKSIGDNAFMSCISLKSIIIPSGTTRIGSGCFENCINLKEITIPDSVKIINAHAFRNCIALKSIGLPDGLKDISKDTFDDCKFLNDYSVPGDFQKDESENQVCNIDFSNDESSSDFTGEEEKISIFELSSLDHYILNNLNTKKQHSKNTSQKSENIRKKYEVLFSKNFLTPVELNNRI